MRTMPMKKFFVLTLISLLGGSISFASAVNDNIMVRYCIPDNPKVGEAAAWKLEVPAGLISTFCIDVINLRDEPVTMRVAAVDGVKTEDGLGTCGLDTEIEKFGKYVSGIPNEVKL